jgi:hypothetical protein
MCPSVPVSKRMSPPLTPIPPFPGG